jgi:glycosyltransferase involved in cell wall biosynthesis
LPSSSTDAVAPAGPWRWLADAVLDQIGLPCFGPTAPQALAVGTPLISSYQYEGTDWIVEEPAPILPPFSAEEVAGAVLRALDPEWRAVFGERARHWVDRYHSLDRLVAEHLRVYRRVGEAHDLL